MTTTPTPTRVTWTVPQLARALGLSRTRVHQLVQDGSIQAHRHRDDGRAWWRIPDREARRLLRQYGLEPEPTPAADGAA